MCQFLAYSTQTEELLLNLSDLTIFGKPPDFEKLNKKLELIAKVQKTLADSIIIVLSIWPYFVITNCKNRNKDKQFKDVCTLLVQMWIPVFDLHLFPINHLWHIWEVVASCIIYKGTGAVTVLMADSIDNLSLRLEHLKILLEEALNTEETTLTNERLRNCIQYHNWIFK